MQVYPTLKESYSDEAHTEFETKVVPHLRRWLTDQFEKSDTAVLGNEQIIVTWNGSMHAYTVVRFL